MLSQTRETDLAFREAPNHPLGKAETCRESGDPAYVTSAQDRFQIGFAVFIPSHHNSWSPRAHSMGIMMVSPVMIALLQIMTIVLLESELLTAPSAQFRRMNPPQSFRWCARLELHSRFGPPTSHRLVTAWSSGFTGLHAVNEMTLSFILS